VIVIVAVYAVPAANVLVTVGDQETVAEYWPLSTVVDTGVAPVAGAVTPAIAAVVIGALTVNALLYTVPHDPPDDESYTAAYTVPDTDRLKAPEYR
jgi:hypothetical protein